MGPVRVCEDMNTGSQRVSVPLPYRGSQTEADSSAVTGLKQRAREISEVGVKCD